jgi:ubiquinone/menaquinone biosynthesis C-methylase UbiE
MINLGFTIRYSMLFKFLQFCNNSELEKKILDCGAGGPTPPLSIFKEHGYDTTGIDIDKTMLERSIRYQKDHAIDLNILEMDMLEMTFEEETFSFVYSFNTIFHMTKQEMKSIIDKVYQILKPGGRFYANLMTTNCTWYIRSKHESLRGEEGELYLEEGGEEVLHTFLSFEEAEKMFGKFQIDNRQILTQMRPKGDSIYEEIHFFAQKPV